MAKEVVSTYQLSINRACKICSTSQSAFYYRPKKHEEDEKIKTILRDLATKHSRWGFEKMMAKIKTLKHGWNHKRVYRLYCELKLNLRVKPRKRLVAGEAKPIIQPIMPNICWSMDFMSDVLSNGLKFRTFNVLDDYNREALLIDINYSIPAKRVTHCLNKLISQKGCPDMIRVDNGPEYTSKCFKDWAHDRGILIHYIQPGKPAQNGLIERFNRTFREDILDMYLFGNLNEVKEITKPWITFYNEERPHQSIANLTPKAFAKMRETHSGHEKQSGNRVS